MVVELECAADQRYLQVNRLDDGASRRDAEPGELESIPERPVCSGADIPELGILELDEIMAEIIGRELPAGLGKGVCRVPENQTVEIRAEQGDQLVLQLLECPLAPVKGY